MNGENNLLSTLRSLKSEIKRKQIENESKKSDSAYGNLMKEIDENKKKYLLDHQYHRVKTHLPYLFFNIEPSRFFLFSLLLLSLFSVFSMISRSGIKFSSANVKLLVPDEEEMRIFEDSLRAKLRDEDALRNFAIPKGFSSSKIHFDTVFRENSSNLFYVNAVTDDGTPFAAVVDAENLKTLKVIDISFE